MMFDNFFEKVNRNEKTYVKISCQHNFPLKASVVAITMEQNDNIDKAELFYEDGQFKSGHDAMLYSLLSVLSRLEKEHIINPVIIINQESVFHAINGLYNRIKSMSKKIFNKNTKHQNFLLKVIEFFYFYEFELVCRTQKKLEQTCKVNKINNFLNLFFS